MKLILPFAFLLTAAGFAGCLWIDWGYQPLPHRAINELTNWGQGRTSATNHCPPNTIRFETDEGLFLECSNVGHYYRGNVP
jgi:hypothetical protein